MSEVSKIFNELEKKSDEELKLMTVFNQIIDIAFTCYGGTLADDEPIIKFIKEYFPEKYHFCSALLTDASRLGFFKKKYKVGKSTLELKINELNSPNRENHLKSFCIQREKNCFVLLIDAEEFEKDLIVAKLKLLDDILYTDKPTLKSADVFVELDPETEKNVLAKVDKAIE